MADKPLMPKATAVWLVDNTSLTFEQIADFCGLHPLEVKGIADEDVAKGIKGQDPVASGQLTRDQIEKAEGDPKLRLKLAPSPSTRCRPSKRRRCRATRPVSKRQDKPDAVYWILRNHPGIHRRRHHQADRHDQGHDPEDPRALALECDEHQGRRSGDAGPLLADRTRPRRRTRLASPRPADEEGGEEGRVAETDRRNGRCGRSPAERRRRRVLRASTPLPGGRYSLRGRADRVPPPWRSPAAASPRNARAFLPLACERPPGATA